MLPTHATLMELVLRLAVITTLAAAPPGLQVELSREGGDPYKNDGGACQKY